MGSALGRSTAAAGHDETETIQAQELGLWRSNQCFGDNNCKVIGNTAAPKKSTAFNDTAADRIMMAPHPVAPAKRSWWCRQRRCSLLLGARPSAKVRPVSSSEEEGSIEIGNNRTTIGTAPVSPTTSGKKAPLCGEDIKEGPGGSISAEAEKELSCLGRLLTVYLGELCYHCAPPKVVVHELIFMLIFQPSWKNWQINVLCSYLQFSHKIERLGACIYNLVCEYEDVQQLAVMSRLF